MMLDNVARLAAAQEAAEEEAAVPLQRRKPWPSLAAEAFHGLAGRYIRLIEPHTEADPAGILVQFLTMFGNLVGRTPHFSVEADRHHLNLFAVLVGASSKGRKGVSAGQARRLFADVDADWCDNRISRGLSSGEGLIWAVRDPIERTAAVRDKGKLTGEHRTTTADSGVDDKRLLVIEAEFASTLRVMRRDGSTLSATIRNAWDSGRLQTMTKNSPASATDAHISIIGHITKDELLRCLDSTEAGNGFGNRFLWCCVKRSKLLPEGGTVHALDFEPLVRDLNECVTFARRSGLLQRDDEARRLWARIYEKLSTGRPGLLGAMIGRAEAQTMRLACLYALLDRSEMICAEHLLAALAVWTYCEESATWIFGEAMGDPVADEILRSLRCRPDGLTRTEISKLFSGHCSKAELGRALHLLAEHGSVSAERESTGGRSKEIWRVAEESPQGPSAEVLSLTSLLSQPNTGADDRSTACGKSELSERSAEAATATCGKSEVSEESPAREATS